MHCKNTIIIILLILIIGCWAKKRKPKKNKDKPNSTELAPAWAKLPWKKWDKVYLYAGAVI